MLFHPNSSERFLSKCNVSKDHRIAVSTECRVWDILSTFIFRKEKNDYYPFTFSIRVDTLEFVSSSSRILLKSTYSNGSVASKSNSLPSKFPNKFSLFPNKSSLPYFLPKWRIPSKKNSTSRPFLSIEALKFKWRYGKISRV